MFSKRIFVIATILAVTIFSANVFAEVKSATIVAARAPLTHKITGVYGWWQPYFWEGPFDFVIAQAFVLPHESLDDVQNASHSEGIKLWNENTGQMLGALIAA